ncbi:MAG TPA: xanthine dehydrogenase family protein molybdopterin-binding subunit [Acidimicrobiales bacterium]|nr:xanthine dehydrogenase family protein molybdopterin-binding subunit [Acidimicrobiales bacterium]
MTASTMARFGESTRRAEDARLLTRGGNYVDDIALPGAVWAAFVRSTVAHAAVTGVDVAEAATAPGVIAAYTGADLGLASMPLDFPILPPTMPRPPLATDVVRYVGEPVAVVVAESRELAVDAAEGAIVDYDPRPVVVDVDAAAGDGVVLHPGHGSNVCTVFDQEPADLSGCEVVVRHRIVNQRVAPCPLEVQATACHWTHEGRLEVWTTSQGPHPIRAVLAGYYGLAPEQVRVVSPDVGGGFGAKSFMAPETLVLPELSRRCGRPVRWTETRSESMLGLGHGRAQVQDVVIGGTRDGDILAYDLTVLGDAGAYPRIGAFLPMLTKMMHPGVYRIPATACRARAVVTNTVPVVAYRGAGRPEATAAIERAVDLFAAEIGMDPADVRRRNLVPADAFPYATTGGTVYDSGQYEQALDLVLEAADYKALRSEQQARRAAGDCRQLGIGLSVYVEVTGLQGGTELGRVAVGSDGRARVLTGTFSHGQGHATAWAMLVSDRTGIPMDRIDVVYGDTDIVPTGGLTGGSRSAQIGGTNVWRAAENVVDQARRIAAELLEAHVEDVLLDTDAGGRFHVAGVPATSYDWAEVATRAEEGDQPLVADGDFELAPSGTYPSGAHLAVVEVDVETGQVTLVRLVAVDDAGRILNPLLAEGQVHGGLAQGAAQALFEEFIYDADGNPLTGNLADYSFPSAAELPSFETVHLETASPLNDLGVKGIGESGSIGSTPAIQNAVVDALAHLGVRHVPMPCTPERVWRAISEGTA